MEILPMLRAAGWSGWPGVAGRDLPGHELRADVVDARGAPITDQGERFAALEAVALTNLRKRPAQWLVTERRGLLDMGGRALRVEHVDEFACERLLDRDFLSRAHQL